MKSYIWILNLTISVLVLIVLGYILFSLKNITQSPEIEPFAPSGQAKSKTAEVSKPKDIKIIYEDKDIFGTYKAVEQIKPPLITPTIPKPPMPKPAIHAPKPQIQFLEPLPITISGIVTSSNEAKSHVIFVDNVSKQSKAYKVGDKIFDAYIIRILPKKVILIRSNGQQENIFLTTQDAQQEIKSIQNISWDNAIEQVSNNEFTINTKEFLNHINNIAQLQDMLDAKTAYRQGKSIGTLIGKIEPNSIGYKLGFVPGDIIISINGVEANTSKNLLKIYNDILAANNGANVSVEFLRRSQDLTHNYKLIKQEEAKKIEKKVLPKQDSQKKIITTEKVVALNENYKNLVDEKYRLNPIVANIKKNDRLAMKRHGSRNSILKGMPNKG